MSGNPLFCGDCSEILFVCEPGYLVLESQLQAVYSEHIERCPPARYWRLWSFETRTYTSPFRPPFGMLYDDDRLPAEWGDPVAVVRRLLAAPPCTGYPLS